MSAATTEEPGTPHQALLSPARPEGEGASSAMDAAGAAPVAPATAVTPAAPAAAAGAADGGAPAAGAYAPRDLEAGAPDASDDEVVEFRSGHQCCAKVGNTTLICGTHPGEHTFPRKCLVGPDWPCLMCTYTLIIVPNIGAMSYVFLDAHWIFMLLACIAFGFSLLALSLVACTDPGIVPHRPAGAVNTGSNRNICRKCNVPRRPGTLHCYDCNCCVEEMDHHCPWTGKCVGKRNLCFFYTFLTAIVVNIFYVVAGVFVHMSTEDWANKQN